MYYGKLIKALSYRVKDIDAKLSDTKTRLGLYINQAYKEVYAAHDWEYRKRTGQIVLIPNYTTGTATVTKFDGTNDSAARSVTFSQSLPPNVVGRYFQPAGSTNWYKIVYASGATAYLDSPIVEDSGTGSFTIWKRFYYLPSEVDVVLSFGKWGGYDLDHKSISGLGQEYANIAATGTVEIYTAYGIDPYDDQNYTTGSIQIAQNSDIVTGTTTSWLGNVTPGDILIVNTYTFSVKRVETDTRIILNNFAPAAIAAGTTYRIEKNNPLGFEFFYNADGYHVLPFTYLSKGFDMVNEDYDKPLLPDRFEMAILSRAEYLVRKDADDPARNEPLAVYNAELDGLRLKRSVVNPPFRQFAPYIPTYMPGRGNS